MSKYTMLFVFTTKNKDGNRNARDSFNLNELVSVLWAKRVFIILVSSLFAVVAIFFIVRIT